MITTTHVGVFPSQHPQLQNRFEVVWGRGGTAVLQRLRDPHADAAVVSYCATHELFCKSVVQLVHLICRCLLRVSESLVCAMHSHAHVLSDMIDTQ